MTATSSPRGNLFIVSSPSGGGKTTLIRRLMTKPPGQPLHFSVRTRPVRSDEARSTGGGTASDGDAVRGDGPARRARAHEVHGNSRHRQSEVLRASRRGGRGARHDVQGARDIRAALSEAVSIFIVPSSAAELERRLRHRGLDGEDAIRKRLINAAKEIAQAESFQYVIVNDDLDRASLELESVVRAARLTPARQAKVLERLRKDFQ
jgi:guanylate kinase